MPIRNSDEARALVNRRWAKYKQSQQTKNALPIRIEDIDVSRRDGVKELHSRITKYILSNDDIDRLTIQKLRILLANLRAHGKHFEIDEAKQIIAQKEQMLQRLEDLK